MKVVFCTLYLGNKPTQQFQQSLAASIPAIEAEGWEHSLTYEANCPYISAARAKVLRRAIDGNADFIVFLDYDVSWTSSAMVKLLATEGHVVAGTYRKKTPQIEYMGAFEPGPNGLIVRDDGCIKASKVPAGFLKLSKQAVEVFARAYPELLFGNPMCPELDLFNHGVIDGVWYGEDYAFCKRWTEKCGDIWIVPDLDIAHHSKTEDFPGNMHKYLKSYNKSAPINENPLVSVVIPAYNYARFITETIDSILSQTYKNIEIIVVNDGSTDDTEEVLLEYYSAGKIKYIRKPNGGSASARNAGIDKASGEWVMCLDADDKIKPTYIEKLLKLPDADIMCSALQYFGNRGGVHTFSEKPNYYDFCKINQIHCASLFRREIWDKVGGFDTKLHSVYDDWEFWIHATKLGYLVKTIPEPLFLYRKHGTSMIDQANERHEELYSYIKEKHDIG